MHFVEEESGFLHKCFSRMQISNRKRLEAIANDHINLMQFDMLAVNGTKIDCQSYRKAYCAKWIRDGPYEKR